MPSRKIEEQLAALKALRLAGPGSATEAAVRAGLRDRVNVVVAHAASIAADLSLQTLTPELCAALDRMFAKAVQTDPQCSAKNALAKALKHLDYADSTPFVRGLQHVQMEPVWGGEEDTAITLRGTCALALVQTNDLPRRQILRYLIGALTDGIQAERSAPVRADAALALEQMNGEEAALLLHLKARTGDVSPAVTGQVFDSLIRLEGEEGVSFVSGFLGAAEEEVREEAALSLGASRLASAVAALRATWETTRSPELRAALLRGISASQRDEAIEFLLTLVRTGRERDALAALSALELHASREEIRAQISKEVETRTESTIQAAFRDNFAKSARD